MNKEYSVKYFIVTMPNRIKYWAISRSKERLAKRWGIKIQDIEKGIDYWGLPHISEYNKECK